MDVLRKELNAFYQGQNLSSESLDYSVLSHCIEDLSTTVSVDRDVRVITDASADYCYIFGGAFSSLIGLCDSVPYFAERDSSDEDEIYNRIHPEDLVDKRMLEYEFFRFIDTISDDRKLDYVATCRIRIMNKHETYIFTDNSTRILRLSPEGKVWLILCGYDLSRNQNPEVGIAPRIIDHKHGIINDLCLSDKRARILTEREREILSLIKDGKLSKQIAGMLGISVNTVNRHRQNILEKLSVANSVEAVAAATMMKLL